MNLESFSGQNGEVKTAGSHNCSQIIEVFNKLNSGKKRKEKKIYIYKLFLHFCPKAGSGQILMSNFQTKTFDINMVRVITPELFRSVAITHKSLTTTLI